MFSITNFQVVYLTVLCIMTGVFYLTYNKPARNTAILMAGISILELFVVNHLRETLFIPKETFLGYNYFFWIFVYRFLINLFSGICIFKIFKPKGKVVITTFILAQMLIYMFCLCEFLFPNGIFSDYYFWYIIRKTPTLMILNILEVCFLALINIRNLDEIKINLYKLKARLLKKDKDDDDKLTTAKVLVETA